MNFLPGNRLANLRQKPNHGQSSNDSNFSASRSTSSSSFLFTFNARSMSYVRCLKPRRRRLYPRDVVPVFGRRMPTTFVALTGRTLVQVVRRRLLILLSSMAVVQREHFRVIVEQ